MSNTSATHDAKVMRNAKRKRGRLTRRHKSCLGNVKLDKLAEKGRNSASCSFFFFFLFFNSSSWDRHGTAAGSQLLKRQWLLHKHYISKQMDRAGEGGSMAERKHQRRQEKRHKLLPLEAIHIHHACYMRLTILSSASLSFSLLLPFLFFSLFFVILYFGFRLNN